MSGFSAGFDHDAHMQEADYEDEHEMEAEHAAQAAVSAPRARRGRRIRDDDDDDDDDAAVDSASLFGEQEGGSSNNNGNWDPYLDGIDEAEEEEQRTQHQSQPNFNDDDAGSEAGLSDNNSADDGLTYDGFDESILKVGGVAQPLLLPRDELWKCVEVLGPNEMRPKRAMRVLVPTDFFRRDAEFFRQWQLPKGCESRCRATAAIVSLLFAGTQMGFPSGKHEEKMRQQAHADEQDQQQGAGGRNAGKARATPIQKVSRYTYVPHDVEQDSWPMFQIGIEDIYNSERTEIVLLGVWLFIYDEYHSTSELVRRVVQNTHGLKTAKQVSGASAMSRSRDATAEADRQGKAGFGFQQLRDNFEGTVGIQYQTISTMDDWQLNLDLHSGRTSTNKGRPCVPNLAQHINCAAGRRLLDGDSRTGCGGRHPMAPEFVFNAKRAESLAYGAVHLDGTNMDVYDDQLKVSSYWLSDGHFQVPQIGIPCFWMCTSVEKRTIFDLPLTRPLQGTVTPGNDLMKLFLETELRARNTAEGCPDRPIRDSMFKVDQDAMNRLRSLATGKDEHQRRQDQMLRNSVLAYDLMSSATSSALSNGDVDYDPNAVGDEANYTIRTVSMTKRVSIETDRIYTKVVAPWVSLMEKKLGIMARELQDRQVPSDDEEWQPYWDARSNFNERFYKVKKDLTQYHLRLLRTCFLSTKDATTLPSGYRAMFRGLEEGVKEHGGSASIAFNGGKNGKGRQLIQSDRQVWGSLQEWLRCIFVDHCRISGRDRRIMDEIFLHIFEMYADTTFVLVIASEKGKGKSVRAMRMAQILPDGWCSFNSATTQRSGMNGNNSPSNGTTVVCDEMISDLTPSEPTERMEFWKTIVGKREFEIERTRSVKNADGTDSHVTFKIVTDHKETYLICCNMGQCFTAGNEEPTAGKEAMIQRTVCLQARAEADDDSPEDEFRANLKHPEVAPNISDFRLFCSLCGYARMAMMGIDWLQPDFAIANLIFKAGDRMLVEEYCMPKPEPRRLVKRKENLITMCVHEAVARVFFFKQTAMSYEAGRPDNHGRGKKFDVGDLWDVLRTLRPTREMILAAWSHSLEYSIGTSSHGFNVMTAVCEKLGFIIDYIFRRLPTRKAEELSGLADSFELDSFMTEIRGNVAGGAQLETASDGKAASRKSLDSYEVRMRNSRIMRNDFRRQAADMAQESQPLQSIEAVVGKNKMIKYADALFPTIVTASMYYKPQTLLKWATGKRVDKEEINTPRGGKLDFKERETQGGAKLLDFGWLVLYNPTDRAPSWSGLTKERLKDAASVTLFDMHVQGVADAMFMLSTSENARLLAEQPRVPWVCRTQHALIDQEGNKPNKQSLSIGLRPVQIPGQAEPAEAHEGSVQATRLATGEVHSTAVPMHKQLDLMHQRCRLSALQPHTSTKIMRGPPIRRSDGAIEVNSVAALEHVNMLMEAILRCSKISGLKGLQERFQNANSAPNCLKAPDSKTPLALNGMQLLDTVRVLPYSIDLMQMAWTLDLASRMYTPSRDEVRDAFNSQVQSEGLGFMIRGDDIPEITLRYPGFPFKDEEKTEALRLISLKTSVHRPEGQKVIDIASANPLQELDPELLRYETEVAIGGKADEADIEEHRRSLIGAGYAYGVKGDVFDYNVWADQLQASMCGRGNTDGKEDQYGRLRDAGMVNILDAEFMFEARMVERKCQAGYEGFEKLDISIPSGSTYSWLEKHPQQVPTTGQKRKCPVEAPRMRATASSRLQSQYASVRRPMAGSSSGDRQPLSLRSGDSRVG